MNGYIYAIVNTFNNKHYIGQTKNKLSKRKYEHFFALRNNKHWNVKIQGAWNKYGEENFEFKCLYQFESELPIKEFRLQLDEFEVSFIKECNSLCGGYNLTTGGKSCVVSDETRRKMSESKMGEKNHFFGKKHKPGIYDNRIAWNKGMKGLPGGVAGGVPHHQLETKKQIAASTRKSRSTITPEQSIEICRRALSGEKYALISKDFDVSQKVISDIKRGVRWADVTEHLR